MARAPLSILVLSLLALIIPMVETVCWRPSSGPLGLLNVEEEP